MNMSSHNQAFGVVVVGSLVLWGVQLAAMAVIC